MLWLYPRFISLSSFSTPEEHPWTAQENRGHVHEGNKKIRQPVIEMLASLFEEEWQAFFRRKDIQYYHLETASHKSLWLL